MGFDMMLMNHVGIIPNVDKVIWLVGSDVPSLGGS